MEFSTFTQERRSSGSKTIHTGLPLVAEQFRFTLLHQMCLLMYLSSLEKGVSVQALWAKRISKQRKTWKGMRNSPQEAGASAMAQRPYVALMKTTDKDPALQFGLNY